MTKREYYEKYCLSDARPLNPVKIVTPAVDFADALAFFINEYFRGAAGAQIRIFSGDNVLVNLEYTAFFIKNLLTAIFGRTYVEFIFREAKDGIVLEIRASSPLPLTYEETNAAIKDARNAGFDVKLTEYGFLLSLDFRDAATYRVYATERITSRRALVGKFCEICFKNLK